MGGPTKQDTEGSTSRTLPNAIDFEVLKAFAATTVLVRAAAKFALATGPLSFSP